MPAVMTPESLETTRDEQCCGYAVLPAPRGSTLGDRDDKEMFWL